MSTVTAITPRDLRRAILREISSPDYFGYPVSLRELAGLKQKGLLPEDLHTVVDNGLIGKWIKLSVFHPQGESFQDKPFYVVKAKLKRVGYAPRFIEEGAFVLHVNYVSVDEEWAERALAGDNTDGTEGVIDFLDGKKNFYFQLIQDKHLIEPLAEELPEYVI